MSKFRGLKGWAAKMSAQARDECWLGAGNPHQGSHGFASRFEVCAVSHGDGFCILGYEQDQSQINQDESHKLHLSSGFLRGDRLISTQQYACRFKEYLSV
ncbi:hypothetical protein [Bradyrhizobium sp. Rc3b]|uniref:hypothetical protein n=1 Tax=Bradyrhizobium sp. Rc3b TaxID=1855322 RepID=UPI0011601DD2|nr:hypothetical protein [Bradyrhizobium sp. Rc3b]